MERETWAARQLAFVNMFRYLHNTYIIVQLFFKNAHSVANAFSET
jgi:hypothetical protein